MLRKKFAFSFFFTIFIYSDIIVYKSTMASFKMDKEKKPKSSIYCYGFTRS